MSTPTEFRHRVRSKQFVGPTAGHCGNYAQANLAIVPGAHADEFVRFCVRNPRACPILAVSDAGRWNLPELGGDLDVRTDVPGYNVYRDGVLSEQPDDLLALWRDDLVAVAIGCSFSFEYMLSLESIPLRHIEEGVNVPMYRTSIPNQGSGRFGGNLIVSMRPMSGRDAIRAVQLTSRFPSVHGAPIHLGSPRVLGIADLAKPDFGDAVTIREDEIPVFWACGVTPQAALESARLPFAIAHRPGHMLMTDIENASLSVF